MNKRVFQYTIIFLLSLLTIGSFAQDNRTTDTKVADALAQMPVNDLEHLNNVMAELAGLGKPGFDKMSQMLTAPGVGDDTAVRFAINGLARYASSFGREEVREMVEAGLLDALKNHADTEVKTFLLNQLNLVGGNNSVMAIKELIAADDLVEPVAQTLVEIGSPEAAKALYEALAGADVAAQVTLVRALGVLKYDEAVSTISTFAESQNAELKKAALIALGSIGHPDSYKLLFKNFNDGNAEAVLIYANRLGERGNIALCRKALNTIIKNTADNGKLHFQAAALSVYAKHFDFETLPLLEKAVVNGDKEFRYAVLNIAEKIGGVAGTRRWIEKAASVSPEIKADVIAMLGRRGDAVTVDYVKANLNDASPIVREEAVAALVKLQGKEAVPVLIAHMAKGNDLDATKAGLLQLLGKQHLAPVAEQLGKTSGAVKAAFIDLIAAKSGNAYFKDILSATGSQSSEEKAAAFEALKNVSTGENLVSLVELLHAVDSPKEIVQVQQAVTAAAGNLESEKTENGIVLQALKNSDKKERLIVLLPEIGGKTALSTVTGYFNDSAGNVKQAAFEALAAWKDYSAANALYEIAQHSSGEYREKAFTSFVRQVRAANLSDDQKLLQYRKVMPFASGTADKQLVINSIATLKTFLSLVYLEQYLDDRELQQPAARAIMRIALPDSNGKNGFSGDKVRGMLKRVASVISGEESEYDIININNYLDKLPEDEGYVSMFNGKDLEGWQGLVGNPVSRSKMSEQELLSRQKEANKKMLENWAVQDNTIVFNGSGDNLCSVKKYGDFEMIVDWRITKNGDSGIYLRGTPQVQIWDIARVDVGAQVGSGGLYNNQKHESKPLKLADNPVGEWNTFRIRMIGENVTVYLNGELVVDNVPLENYWDRKLPIFEKEAIELQAHGTDLAFRNIYVKEIKTEEIGLTEIEKAEGFISLFNGMNLDGWQGNKTDYFAQNGELIVQPARGGHGNLFTDKEYSDFIFRFEFQLTPGANNGLGIRAPLEGDAAYSGMELQILDNTAPVYANLQEYQYHGSVYGVIPAKRGFLKPVGEWNEQEVVVKGSKIKITLNGTVIVDGDIAEASQNGTLDKKEHPGLNRKTGYIGFLGHGSELKFRNIRIKELKN